MHPKKLGFNSVFVGIALLLIAPWHALAQEPIVLARSAPPPEWALLEQAVLNANSAACREFFGKYFDDRGYLRCVERWGGDDGPDDAIENINEWPILYAIGGDEAIRKMIWQAWEGHVEQFTKAKTTHVPFARDGMYYREFPVMMDWLHNGEGLTVFNLMGLCDPEDSLLQQRIRRFAGFYLGDDPAAENYDKTHKLIRSLFNGSRGPLLRKATAVDWAGDPIEVKHRFRLGHGEDSYEQMLEHFKDYTDILGDHPQNLLATSLAANAFMLDHDEKYRNWLLEYVTAWEQRAASNGGILPSNVGRDGITGSDANGKWYGGTYGWGFSVVDPVTGNIVHRNTTRFGVVGFGNALLLSGEMGHLDAWRTQIKTVNSNARETGGKKEFPRMFGDDGWYAFQATPYQDGADEIWYWSMQEADLEYVDANPWRNYLNGRLPSFPVDTLRSDLASIRHLVAAMRNDETTPDTRLSDDPMNFNPCTVNNLVHLMMGGIPTQHRGSLLHCRLRYFDPIARKPGLPPRVMALVDRIDASQTRVQFANLDQLDAKEVVVQAGAYGEHQITSVEVEGKTIPVNHSTFNLQLAPGALGELVIHMDRYRNRPTLRYPWDARRLHTSPW